MNKQTQLLSLLIDIEVELRNINCWDSISPSEQSLSSIEPFCVDTLEFYQWLQWIFVPRLRWMIEQEMSLPTQSNITAMAEEWASSRAMLAENLIKTLEQIDRVLTTHTA